MQEQEIIIRNQQGQEVRMARYSDRFYINGLRVSLASVGDTITFTMNVETTQGWTERTYHLSGEEYFRLMHGCDMPGREHIGMMEAQLALLTQ